MSLYRLFDRRSNRYLAPTCFLFFFFFKVIRFNGETWERLVRSSRGYFLKDVYVIFWGLSSLLGLPHRFLIALAAVDKEGRQLFEFLFLRRSLRWRHVYSSHTSLDGPHTTRDDYFT